MKKFLVVSALVLSSRCLASAQSTEPQTRDNTATRYDEPHHNFGWLGLLGLVGLVGFVVRKAKPRKDSNHAGSKSTPSESR
jgi:hypothetical protein